MGSQLGRYFRVTTFGESHGPGLGCVVENCPAGLLLCEEDIQKELDRRRPGQSRITTPRQERDRVEILSGVFEGKTLGTPIALLVRNENARAKDYEDFRHIYRPSHADYTYDMRYGHRAHLGGGRASARTTIGVVAAGAIAKKILREKFGVEICAYVAQIKDLALAKDFKLPDIRTLQQIIEQNEVRCPDNELAQAMYRLIQDTRQDGDSLGGVIEAVAENVPPGWGDPVFDRLDAMIARAILAIPATKGVEIGSGFRSTTMTGSEHNDLFYVENGKIRTRTNHSGGIQGGISNGERIFVRVAFKPTATIARMQTTVTDQKEEVVLKVKGRHDPCVLPRAVPIVEAMLALVLVDAAMGAKLARLDSW
ncbi:MAG: chorismate synthase [Leptospiraceae bacterium]|nr:chorismate synthase [Leptospiraceae bacterium]MDW8307066.1 chorismate synthase [Leptospiraceae bacterium]